MVRMVSIKKNSQGRWPLADVKSFCRGQALRGRRRVFLLGFGRSVSHFILPSTISVRAISAVLNPAVSMISGRLPPEFSWRTRREIRLINTLGLPTNFNAFSLNSAFKIILFSQKKATEASKLASSLQAQFLPLQKNLITKVFQNWVFRLVASVGGLRCVEF